VTWEHFARPITLLPQRIVTFARTGCRRFSNSIFSLIQEPSPAETDRTAAVWFSTTVLAVPTPVVLSVTPIESIDSDRCAGEVSGGIATAPVRFSVLRGHGRRIIARTNGLFSAQSCLVKEWR
jgi:hypothetical protein